MSDTNEEAKGGEGGSEPITIRIRDQVRNRISVAFGQFRWCRQILVNSAWDASGCTLHAYDVHDLSGLFVERYTHTFSPAVCSLEKQSINVLSESRCALRSG